MECSILQDLAVFDTEDPISVSIFFEDCDEFEDIPIKTENISNDDNSQSKNQLADFALKLKTEIKEKPEQDGTKDDAQTEENILKVATCLSENLQSSVPIRDESRKRKQMLLQIYKNKRPNQTPLKESSEPSHVYKEISTNASDHSRAERSFMPKSNPQSVPSTDSLKNGTETQAPSDKLSSYIKRCLSPVSEHMRLILEAYSYHKHHKSPKENFHDTKKKLFSLSYSTVVAMLLPEEKNVEFLRTFLKETYRHACEQPSIYKKSYKDFETLLNELLLWTKYNKNRIEKATLQKRNTVLKTHTDNHNVNRQEQDKSDQSPLNSNIEVNKSTKNADNDNICIFSAGSHGNEISINVDPSFKKYLHNISVTNCLENQRLDPTVEQNQSQNSNTKSNSRVETELVKQLTKPPQNYSKNHNQDVIQQPIERPTVSQPVLILDTILQSPGQISASQQMQARLPHVQHPSKIEQVQIPSQQLQQISPQYGHTSEVLPQYKQSTYFPSQCGQSGQSQNVQSSLKKYLDNMSVINCLENQRLGPTVEHNQSQNSNNKSNSRVETDLVKQLTKPPQNYSKNLNQDVIQQPIERPTVSQPVHILDTILQSPGQISASQQMQARLPHVQHPSKMQQVQIPSQQLQQISPQYGHTSEVLPQYKQSTYFSSQCGQTQNVQSFQPQSWQSQLGQQQSKHANYAQAAVWHPPHVLPQYEQQQRHYGHNPPPYDQRNRTQRQFGKQHQLPQYLQSQNVSPQYGMLKYMPTQLGQTQPGLPVPQYDQVQSGNSRNVLPQYAQTQPVKPQAENPLPTEWYQQSNILQHQIQSQIGGSPRSVSTDSGFISPLNFVPSDQTVPPPSEGTETANLLITHVTSLNPKVAFIDEGKCVVCKKATKHVCMGCMQCYYCSYDCQLVDWSNHEPNCKVNK